MALTPSDAGSGVATTQYRQGAQTWLTASGNAFSVRRPPTTQTTERTATSTRPSTTLGNMSAPLGACTVKIDTRMPVTNALGLQDDNHSGWQNSGADGHADRRRRQRAGPSSTSYKLNGGTTQAIRPPSAYDRGLDRGELLVGRRRRQHRGAGEGRLRELDQTPPTVSDDSDPAWHNSDVVVQLTPAERRLGRRPVRGTARRAPRAGSRRPTTPSP